MTNGEINPRQTVKCRVSIDVTTDISAQSRLSAATRVRWKRDLGLTDGKTLHVALAVYWFLFDNWRELIVYAGEGDPPPRPK